LIWSIRRTMWIMVPSLYLKKRDHIHIGTKHGTCKILLDIFYVPHNMKLVNSSQCICAYWLYTNKIIFYFGPHLVKWILQGDVIKCLGTRKHQPIKVFSAGFLC
jgi:hypothetical protein